MKILKPTELNENIIDLIGNQWMLITAGTPTEFNTMTASWGGVGYLWNKPVAFTFVRPNRYTYEFIERADYFTLSFFEEKYRNALMTCGSKSGRNANKVELTGLTPLITDTGSITFEEARMVFECKKLYVTDMKKEDFLGIDIPEKWYKNEPFHKIYVSEIDNILEWTKLIHANVL